MGRQIRVTGICKPEPDIRLYVLAVIALVRKLQELQEQQEQSAAGTERQASQQAGGEAAGE